MHNTLRARFARAHFKHMSERESKARHEEMMNTTLGSTGFHNEGRSSRSAFFPRLGSKSKARKPKDATASSYVLLSDSMSAKDMANLLQQHSSMMIECEGSGGAPKSQPPSHHLHRRRSGREDELRPGSFGLRVVLEAFRLWKSSAGKMSKEKRASTNAKKAASTAAAAAAKAPAAAEGAAKRARPSRKIARSPAAEAARRNDLDEMNPRRREEIIRRQMLVEDATYMERRISELRQNKAMLKVSVESCSDSELYENQCLYTAYALKLKNKKKHQSSALKENSSCNLPTLEPRQLARNDLVGPAPSPSKSKASLIASVSMPALPSGSKKSSRATGDGDAYDDKLVTKAAAQQVRTLRQLMRTSIAQRDGIIELPPPVEASPVHSDIMPEVRKIYRATLEAAALRRVPSKEKRLSKDKPRFQDDLLD